MELLQQLKALMTNGKTLNVWYYVCKCAIFLLHGVPQRIHRDTRRKGQV